VAREQMVLQLAAGHASQSKLVGYLEIVLEIWRITYAKTE
jgi:hypothetical protein